MVAGPSALGFRHAYDTNGGRVAAREGCQEPKEKLCVSGWAGKPDSAAGALGWREGWFLALLSPSPQPQEAEAEQRELTYEMAQVALLGNPRSRRIPPSFTTDSELRWRWKYGAPGGPGVGQDPDQEVEGGCDSGDC